MIEFTDKQDAAKIKVIGVGGGGGNAINTMVAARLEGVEFIAANTDVQALAANRASVKIQLGKSASRGLSRQNALRSLWSIRESKGRPAPHQVTPAAYWLAHLPVLRSP